MKISRHAAWCWPAALIGAVCWASSNIPAAPDLGLSFQDKIIHALVFGLLANLLQRAAGKSGVSPVAAFLVGAGLVSFFGGLDEWHQAHTPGRASDVWDWVADTAGGLLAGTLYLTDFLRYRRILEHPLFKKTIPPKKS